MNPLFKAMQPKKKRPVDPNAPPRPNLLSHEKTLKDVKLAADAQADMVIQLQRKVAELETKLAHQSNYLNSLHQYVMSKLSKNK